MKKGEEVEFGKGMRRREWDEKGMRRAELQVSTCVSMKYVLP